MKPLDVIRENLLLWAFTLILTGCGVLISSSSYATTISTVASACVTPDGGNGAGCVNDNTAPIGNQSQTSSGTNSSGVTFSSTASAFLDASDFGELRIAGSASVSGGAQAGAQSRIIIEDLINLSNPSFNGQSGLFTATVLVVGSTSTSNNVSSGFDGQATAQWDYRFVTGVTEPFFLFNRVIQLDDDTFSVVSSVNNVSGSTYGLFTFDIPFTWGTPLSVQPNFNGSAQALGTSSFVNTSASYDLANSIFWGGFSNVRAGGLVVSTYDFTSDSGFDWRSSSIPQSAVPEPSSLALLAVGLTAVLATRCRRKGKYAP
jgi:hypothetical protein